MASSSLRTDSPITQCIVQSFLDFLGTVETAPGVDREGLEVAAQCLSEVFRLNQTRDGDNRSSVPSLLDLFMQDQAKRPTPAEKSKEVMADMTMDPMAEPPSAPPLPPSISGSGQSAKDVEGARMDKGATTAGLSGISIEELFEQFRDGLDLSGYFNGYVKNTPEYLIQIKQAKTIFEDSLKKFKYSPGQATEQDDAKVLAEAFKVQGNSSVKEQRFMEAIQLYTLAISLCSNNAIFYANRAAAHSEVGKFGEAIADCEKAIQIDPLYSKAYSRLGWVYHAQGRFQEAIDKGFQKALNMDPNNATAKENLLAAQQKLAEQQRETFNQQHQQHQQHQQGQQGQHPFTQTGMPNFGGQIPANIQLPPEMANLIPGIMNLAAQFGHRQGDNMEQGAATAANHSDGLPDEHDDHDVRVDTNINFTVNGQEVPPQFAELMGSVLQMFGNGGGAPNTGHQHQGPPGGPA